MSTTASRPDLAESFNRFFRIAPARTEAEKNDVYFIRHDVYARELGFEPERPEQRETDAFDARSEHCLLRTAEAAPRLVGCARVVYTDPQDPAAPLPFEKACRDSLHRDVIDPARKRLEPERPGAREDVERVALQHRHRGEAVEEAHLHAVGNGARGLVVLGAKDRPAAMSSTDDAHLALSSLVFVCPIVIDRSIETEKIDYDGELFMQKNLKHRGHREHREKS